MTLQMIMLGTGKNQPVSFVTSTELQFQSADASRTLTVTGIETGDFLFSMTANRASTAPTLSSGYTNITTSDGVYSSGYRSLRLQYKIASSTSDSITWTGAYGMLVVCRNVSGVGQYTTYSEALSESTSHLIPGMSGLVNNGTSMLLGGSYISGNYYTSVTSPWVLKNNSFAILTENTLSSYTGNIATGSGTYFMDFSGSLVKNYWAIELKS